ncbi:hypothetical protein D3C76_1426140 [compost metagenome]
MQSGVNMQMTSAVPYLEYMEWLAEYARAYCGCLYKRVLDKQAVNVTLNISRTVLPAQKHHAVWNRGWNDKYFSRCTAAP